MIIDLTRLNNGLDKFVDIDEEYSFKDLDGTGVTSIDNVSITGTITLNAINNVELSLDVDGMMIIPCAITLKEVEYPFSVSIIEEISPESNTNYQNSLDILPIIWENILMEIPMRVVSEEANDVELSGVGWKLIRDDEKIENAELSKLKDLI